jgi:hypothetical protein
MIIICLIVFLVTAACASEDIYLLNGATIEFRPLGEEEKADNGFSWHNDRRNVKHLVADMPVIDSGDVQAVAFRKSMEFMPQGMKEGDEYDLLIYFKRNSWDKIYDVTSSLIKKKIAVFINGKLFSVPTIFEALNYVGAITPFTEDDKTALIKGMKKDAEFDMSNILNEHLQWLKERADKHPDVSNLIRLYLAYRNDQTLDCEKAKALEDRILQMDENYKSKLLPSDCN